MAMLRVTDVHAAYGPILALHGVSLEVPEGSIVTAAGRQRRRQVHHAAEHLRPDAPQQRHHRVRRAAHRPLPPRAIVSLGISQVPENRQLFAELTVLENLRLGAYVRRDRNGIKEDMEQVFQLLPDPARAARSRWPAPSAAASSRCWPSAAG